jgi:hypothetical protein
LPSRAGCPVRLADVADVPVSIDVKEQDAHGPDGTREDRYQ